MPGYDWAPAWVCWRQAEGHCGWAPLPPAAVFTAGVGLTFHGHLALDVGFGLGPAAFTFVAYDHFWDHNLCPFLLPRERVAVIFPGSRIMNGYRLDHGRFFVEGLGHDHVAVLTHHEVRVVEVGHEPRGRGRFETERHDMHEERRDHR